MLTTLTIDDDVYRRLAALQRRSGDGFKTVVNKALRVGLQALDRAEKAPQERYRMRTSSGGRLLIDITNTSAALARAEGEGHK